MSAAARRWWIGAGVFVLLAWLVGYPLVVTTFAAFVPEAGVTAGSGGGAAVRAPFAEFVSRPDEWTALFRSLWISLASVGLAGLVGVPLGFLFARAEFPGRRVLGELLALPVALPPLVGVIAFLYLYGESGMATRLVGNLVGSAGAPWRLTGPGAILLVHTYSMYVYFYLFTRAALARFDGAQLEAAASLGAGRWRTLTRVVLPGLAPALAAAAILTFLTALGSSWYHLAPDNADEFDLGRGQVDVRADDPEIFVDLFPRFGECRVARQYIVHRQFVTRHRADVQRRVGLRIHVEQADTLPGAGERVALGGERDGLRPARTRS